MYKAIILLTLIAASSAQFLPNGCPSDFNVHLLLPHETDCSKFYSCSNGNRIEMSCAPGTLFDANLQVCNWPFAVQCSSPQPQPTTTTSSTTASVSTTTTTTETTPIDFLPNGCPADFSIHYLLPHETDCSKFYQCSNGVKKEMPCADGTLFDFELQTCVPIAEGGCTYNSTTTSAPSTTQDPISALCPPGTWGNVPHPEICDSFYMCAGGQPIQLYCSDGFEFDPIRGTCVLIAEGGCTYNQGTTPNNPETTTSESLQPTTVPQQTTTESSESETTTVDTSDTTTVESDTTPDVTTPVDDTPAPICAAGVTGLIPHPEICNSFYICVGSVPILLFCSDGYEFDPVARTCVVIAEGGCTLGPATTTEPPAPTTPAPICPPGQWGNILHQDRCDAFYMCAGGTAIQLYCSEGFEFDPNLRTCVAIADGGCTLGSQTTPAIETTTASSGEESEEVSPTTESNEETTDDYELTTVDDPTTAGSAETTDSYETTDALTTGDPSITTADYNDVTTASSEETTESYTTTESSTSDDYSGEVTTPSATTDSDEDAESSTTDASQTTASYETTESSETTDAPSKEDSEEVTVPICPVGVYGNVPDPERCDGYYICAAGVPISLTCSEGFELDPETKVCVEIAEGGCTLGKGTTTPADTDSSETTAAPVPICAPGVFDNIPHPERCDAFYMCAAGQAILLTCGEGHEFDPEIRKCIEIAPGGCTLSNKKTILPTPDKTNGEAKTRHIT